MTSLPWRSYAACRENPDAWFEPADATYARAVCRHCPVREYCLADVLKAERGVSPRSRWGIVAGLSGGERVLLDPDGTSCLPETPEPKPEPKPKPTPKAKPGQVPAPVLEPVVLTGHCDFNDLPRASCAHCRPAPQPPQPIGLARTGRPLAPCGTASAYSRHVARREPIDQPCRDAHAAADRRLRTTGTTKILTGSRS